MTYDQSEPLIVVLGAPNDEMGELSPVALSRAATAAQVHKDNPSYGILPTGGFGAHFNTSPEPHFTHLTRELLNRGVDPALILPGVPSGNTFEDVVGTCDRAHDLGVTRLVVVTSDFHGERAAFLFKHEESDLEIEFCLAESDTLEPALRDRLEEHERSALKRLRA